MKVLDLRCAQGHGFEGWFGSEEDFQSQRSRGLVSCPLCGNASVDKLPSAPRLNLGAHEPAATVTPAVPKTGASEMLWMRAVRHVLAHTEDVGERFAEEARRIHYGEAASRGIRGRASREDTQALLDEGIEVMALPVLADLEGPVQ